MLKMNLLPWRMQKREQERTNKKFYYLLGLWVVSCAAFIIWMMDAKQKLNQATIQKNEFQTLYQKSQANEALLKNKWTQQENFIKTHLVSAAENKHPALDLNNVNLPEALRTVSQLMKMNVIIHPTVKGRISFHLANMPVEQMFNTILTSQGLTRYRLGGAWVIEPRTVFIEHLQDQLRLKEINEESDPLLTRIWRLHFAKAEEMAHLLQEDNTSLVSKRGHVRVDLRTNSLLVQETEKHLTPIYQIVRALDIPVQQVLIEARLASIDTEFERALGIHFEPKMASDSSGSKLPDAIVHYSLAIAKLADGGLLDMQLTALENEGHGELISSPRLFTSNRQPASIESGEEIPYQEVSESGATSVAFKKAVLSLKVTPQVMSNNYVLLQLQVNQDKPNSHLVLGVPSISTRQISTQVLVKNGQTIVLGGIYEVNKEDSYQRIPFLSKIPFLGMIFQQKNQRNDKRELLIFVTPRVFFQTEGEKCGK